MNGTYRFIRMMMGVFYLCTIVFSTRAQGQNLVSDSPSMSKKAKAIQDFRKSFSQQQFRGHSLTDKNGLAKNVALLEYDGQFSDLREVYIEIFAENAHAVNNKQKQAQVSSLVLTAYNRLWRIAESYRLKNDFDTTNDAVLRKLFKGFTFYGNYELSRANVSEGRFHPSCFAIPTAAVNSYFALLPLMDRIENGVEKDALFAKANSVLKEVGRQAWTQPYRNDETDKNVVQIPRFRNHVWWVGGNALGYRPVFPAAIMLRSEAMLDVLSEVAINAIGQVSQNTIETAFWTEGFTADGLGWGHGKQCLVWGYPIDGTAAALELLGKFLGTPWQHDLTPENLKAIFTYLRGSSWCYYKGYELPANDRYSMVYDISKDPPKYSILTNKLLQHWKGQLSSEFWDELLQLDSDIRKQQIIMKGRPSGQYNGTRWFFNNDNLVKKNPDYHIYISMASNRVDGIESAWTFADGYNFFTCDGMTLFQKRGNEYHEVKGGWNLTAIPGVTNRQGEEALKPIENWRGFSSLYNFCGAATSGAENAASGFIHQKYNASEREGVNDKIGVDGMNPIVYKVRSYKYNLMAGDFMLSLGAGITNLDTSLPQTIWTTIDQTLWEAPTKFKTADRIQYLQKPEDGGGTYTVKRQGKGGKKPSWVTQDGKFAYGILPSETKGSVQLKLERRNTKWEKLDPVNKRVPDLPRKVDILQLNIDHGARPENDTYGYIVHAGGNSADKGQLKNPFVVLSNTQKLQAAATVSGTILGASFYDMHEKLKVNKHLLGVSAPCVLLLEKVNTGYTLSVTDPLMDPNLKTLKIHTTIPCSGTSVQRDADGDWYTISIAMPQGKFLGKSRTLTGIEFKKRLKYK